MARSQVQPLLLLVASLLFLPALYAINFEYCNKSGYEVGNVTLVEYSPTVVESYNTVIRVKIVVSASSGSQTELNRTKFVETFITWPSDGYKELTYPYRLSDVTSPYPIKAGTNFELLLHNVRIYHREVRQVNPTRASIALVAEQDHKQYYKTLDHAILCVDFDLPYRPPYTDSASA